ncbi:MAG: AI-2E family transporter [Thermodesulfovibrionales bacterium]|nr:AI-2E family transporter [Thermodesulfovibrionales bacterium]
MAANKFYFITLLFFLILLGYLSYQIFRPFLSPIAWAVVLAIVFYPFFNLIKKYVRWQSLASLITIIVIIFIMIGPFSYVSFLIAMEIKDLPRYLQEGGLEDIKRTVETPLVRGIIEKIISTFNIPEGEIEKSIVESLNHFGKRLLDSISKGISNILAIGLNFVFMIIALFFIFKDGGAFLTKIKDYLPFTEDQKNRLVSQTKDVVVSTIYGGVAVAIVQGTIGGITFFLLGISSPALWGLAISIASFIPLIGAFGVWGPMTIYLFIKGEILQGIILALVGTFFISLIDNILKPLIIGGRTKMPVLLIFFSVLGGIQLFGLIGLILGPLVIAIFISVIDIFRHLEEGGNNA